MTFSNDFFITDSEMEVIEQLKKNLTCDLDEKQFEDNYLFYRFLKARDFDLSQAETMLRKHLQWRKQNNVDKIQMEYKPPTVLKEIATKMKMGTSKIGNSMFFAPIGKLDIKGLVLSAKYYDMEKTFLHALETEINSAKKTYGKKNGWFPALCFVYDMEGLSFAQATDKKALEHFIRITKVFQDNYPELLADIFVINASVYFTFLFNIVKPVLAQSILKKTRVFPKDGWQEEIEDYADMNSLPAFLGGKRTDPDGNPLCLSCVYHGGPIPASYHIHKSKRSLASNKEAKKLVLARAAFSEISAVVEEAGSLLEWEFETKTRDIGFGLFRKELGDEKEVVTEIVPLARLETDNFAETGVYKCEKAGTYVMLFDNSYSWIRSKEIYYIMKVIKPSEQETID